MRKLTVYKTADGKYFEDEKQAQAHADFLALQNWYEENKLYGMYEGSRIDWHEFIEWFMANLSQMEQLVRILNEGGNVDG